MKVDRPRARSSDAPTRLNSWLTRPIWAGLGRHEAARLRQQRDQRVLPQKGRFAAPCSARSAARSPASRLRSARNHWRRRARRPARSARSTTGCRPPSSRKARLSSTTRPAPVFARRQIGEGRRQIDLRQCAGGCANRRRARPEPPAAAPRNRPLFDLQRAVAGVQDPGFHLRQRHSGEPHLVGRGLAVDERSRSAAATASSRHGSPSFR